MMRNLYGRMSGSARFLECLRAARKEALYHRPRTTWPGGRAQDLPISNAWDGDHAANPGLMDIFYIPMVRGIIYLAVALDWFSRGALASRLSITMEASFCVEVRENTLSRHGKPEMFNTDQGSQFTARLFSAC
jgi:putative transposase